MIITHKNRITVTTIQSFWRGYKCLIYQQLNLQRNKRSFV
ncbi:hypothetical protein GNT69_15720 [Bacillus sp. B15-48]|nr:hypothetical protein [Bacillus sp. B15-48]